MGQFFLSQRQSDWTLLPTFLFFSLALWAWNFFGGPEPTPAPSLSRRAETLALAGLFLLAAFFRVFRIDSFPCGISVDQASTGLGGLEVLHGWRPVFETPLLQIPSLIFYPAAVWFRFLAPTQTHLALLCVVFSLTTSLWVYWGFRQLAGPGPAILTLVLLAISSWDCYLGRWAVINLMPGLFIYSTLALWLKGLSKGKALAYLASGFFLGLGLYSYYAYRIFPFVMAVLALWEIRNNPALFRRDRIRWAGMLAVFTAVTAPLCWHWFHEPSFGQGYPGSQFIGWEIWRRKSPALFVENVLRFLGMFNREGDPSPKQTADCAPMLDGVTGALAILGLAWALLHRRERKSSYPLALFAGLGLNNILCTDPTNACHVLPLLPCVTYWAGSALWQLGARWTAGSRLWKRAATGVLLALAAGLNYHQLFDIQAAGKSNPAVFDLGPTLAGRKIAREGDQYDFVLCPAFALHCTVRFLAYDHQADYRLWDWPRDLAVPALSPGKKGIVYLMAEGEEGIYRFLKALYPGCQTEIEKGPQGSPLLCAVRVSREELLASRGLRSVSPKVFSGNLFIPQTGFRQFASDPAGGTSWKIDGQPVPRRKPVFLVRGFHALEIGTAPGRAPGRYWTQGPDGTVTAINSDSLTTLPVNHGLEASYYEGPPGVGPLSNIQWDPLVNFTNRADWALSEGPFSIQWKGRVWIPKEGRYDFWALTEDGDWAQWIIDGRALSPGGPSPSGSAGLRRGWHNLVVDFRGGKDFSSAMSLAWKKPGEGRYEMIPPQAFGAVQSSFDMEKQDNRP